MRFASASSRTFPPLKPRRRYYVGERQAPWSAEGSVKLELKGVIKNQGTEDDTNGFGRASTRLVKLGLGLNKGPGAGPRLINLISY